MSRSKDHLAPSDPPLFSPGWPGGDLQLLGVSCCWGRVAFAGGLAAGSQLRAGPLGPGGGAQPLDGLYCGAQVEASAVGEPGAATLP